MTHKVVVLLRQLRPLRLLGVGCFALVCAGAFAESRVVDRQDTILLAGEIILGPTKVGGNVNPTSGGETNASRQRQAARDYRKEQTATAVVVVPDEEEGGVLSPRQIPTGASENVSRTRASRQGDAGNAVILPPAAASDSAPVSDESLSATSARRNRSKAAEYRKGERGLTVSIKGSDNLPVVDCSNVENVSGRIGDDTHSGSVITLVQGSNQIKVRCR